MSIAKIPSAPEPLTVFPRAPMVGGSILRLLVALLPTLLSVMRSRRDLVLENLAPDQQRVTLAGRRHPAIRPADRAFWILLRRSWSRGAEALATVRPDTVVRWHRAGFRIYWNWVSRRGKRSGRPPLLQEVCALMRRMATENPWGAPRIHTYYNVDGAHIGVGKDSPCGRPVEQMPGVTSNVVSLSRVGGLHHRYAWRQAAYTVSGPRFLWTSPPAAWGDRPSAVRWRRPFPRLESRAGGRLEPPGDLLHGARHHTHGS